MMGVNLSPTAAEHVKGQLETRGKGLGVKLGVRTSGCSGLSYTIEFVDKIQAEDHVFESHNIKLFVDPKSIVYLDGTELHLVKEGLNEGLEFRNPNVSGECGCGESFSV